MIYFNDLPYPDPEKEKRRGLIRPQFEQKISQIIKENENNQKIDFLLQVLNHQLEIDPSAINELFNHSVYVNNFLADDPFIRVSSDNTLRLIGYINNILNCLGLPNIFAKYDNSGNLLGFCRKEPE